MLSSRVIFYSAVFGVVGYILFKFCVLKNEYHPIGEINQTQLDVTWKINDFFSLSSKDYCSESFSFAKESWHLVFFPDGNNKVNNTEGQLSVYLVRESRGPPFRLIFSFSLKSFSGRRVSETFPTFIFEEELDVYGYDRFLSRSELLDRKKELMPSNTLTIICSLKSFESQGDLNVNFPELPQQSKIQQDFQKLYISHEDNDVIIRVKEQDFPAHKIILKARSPVFAAIIRNDMKVKASGIINVENCDSSTFYVFLSFLYNGYSNDITKQNVFSLFTIANNYEVSDMKEKCLEFYKRYLSVDTFFEVMNLALHHSATEIIDLTTYFFIHNAQNIVKTAKWEQFFNENHVHTKKLYSEYSAYYDKKLKDDWKL